MSYFTFKYRINQSASDPADPVFDMTVMGFRLLPFCMFPAIESLGFWCYAQAIEKKKLAKFNPAKRAEVNEMKADGTNVGIQIVYNGTSCRPLLIQQESTLP